MLTMKTLPTAEVPQADTEVGFNGSGHTFAPTVISEADKQLFFERLELVLATTNEYGGTLPAAWDEAQQHRLNPSSAELVEAELDKQQKHKIDEAAKKMKNAGITSVVIEAA